jgi:photosystem II stability/assembly factor-like uncharacterized protein
VNVFKVDSLYRNYHRTHAFQKTTHTQYYKKWRRSVQGMINDLGYVEIPDEATRLQREQEFLAKSGNTRAAGPWTLSGPYMVYNADGTPGNDQANVYSVDQCLSNPNIVYCGTEPGEVYKSVDGGITWNNMGLSMDFMGGVSAIEVDPNNANHVLAGSGNGLFLSNDGGINWTNVIANNSIGVNEILIHPNNSLLVLAACDEGLFRSTDGGANWSNVFSQACYDVKCHPTQDDIVYFLKDNPTLEICEFYRSIDFGINWTIQSNGWYSSTDPDRYNGGGRIGVSPADPDRVYTYLIGDAKANDYGFIGLFRSNDQGSNWTLPNGPVGGPYTSTHINTAYGGPGWTYHQGFYNCALMVSATNADSLLIGGLNLWRSNNGGVTFSSVAGYIGGPLNLHVDMQDFRAVGNHYWITTDGGIYHSTNFLVSQPLRSMQGVHASDFWGFGSGWNHDVLVGGLYHNGNIGYTQDYPAQTFINLGGGEAPTGYVNPGNAYRTYFSDVGGVVLPNSFPGTLQWFSLGLNPNESYWAAESSELEFDPSCYNTVYAGKDHQIWKSEDGGASFTLLYTFGNNANNQVKYMEVAWDNPNVIYLNQQPASGSTGTLYKTTNGGSTWNSVSIPSGNSRRMLISLVPGSSQKIWIAYPSGANGTKVFYSDNGGTSWTNKSTAMLNNEEVHSIVAIGGTDGGIYYCTDRAVYYRNNAMSDWEKLDQDLPAYFNSNIARPFYRDGKIRVASYGKGIWESALYDQPALPIAQAMVDRYKQTVQCETDSFYFDCHSILNHTNASWSWTFQNGSPATSTQRNPAVLFPGPGTYWAVLTVEDASGNTDVDSLQVEIESYNWPAVSFENFEGAFPGTSWQIVDPGGNGQWSINSFGGYGQSAFGSRFDNFNIDSQGDWDDMRLAMSIPNSPGTELVFDVAYAVYGGQYSDTLEILISTDCGQTFTQVYRKGGTQLSTAPNTTDMFEPTSTQWRTDTVDLSAYVNSPEVILAFRNWGHFGQPIYLDNIRIGNPNSVEEQVQHSPRLYPNPVSSQSIIRLDLPQNNACEVRIFNMQGKLIRSYPNVAGTMEIPGLAGGQYLIQVTGNEKIWNIPLVVVSR